MLIMLDPSTFWKAWTLSFFPPNSSQDTLNCSWKLQLPETNCLKKSEPLLVCKRKERDTEELQNIKAHNTPVFSVFFWIVRLKKRNK